MNVYRGYKPEGVFQVQAVGGKTEATWKADASWPVPLKLHVPLDLNYRKVWAWFSTNWTTTTRLKAYIRGERQGAEVFNHPIADYTSGGFDSWFAGFQNAATFVPEALFHTIPSGNTFVMAPWRFNLNVDAIALVIDLITTTAGNCEGVLAVQSWKGV